MKILICDDDPMTLRTLEYQFKREGYETVKTANGREAAKYLDENYDIDLLIADLYMPMMTGMELVTYVRTNLQRLIPIVVISRVNTDENIEQAMELGANAYLVKPFNLEELSSAVKKVMNNEQ